MSTFHSFEIEFPTTHAHTGKVIMDGQELRGITAVCVKGEVDEVVKVALTFLPEKVLVRVAGAQVAAIVKGLVAETTDMGSRNKTYAAVEAK